MTSAESKKILLATDFSPCSDAAAAVALRLARRLGSEVDVLHVTYPGGEDEARRHLDHYLSRFHGTKTYPVVEAGAPAPTILRYAETHGIELLVVGTHGYTGFTRALLGSVAERVARTAPCPVLTVPPTAEPRSFPAGTSNAAARPPDTEGARPCLVCQVPSAELLCDACRARIRAEALTRREHEFTNAPL